MNPLTLILALLAANLWAPSQERTPVPVDRTVSPTLEARPDVAVSGRVQDTTLMMRRVWAGPNVNPLGRVTPDGRHMTFVDWPDLALRDLQSGTVHRLTDLRAQDSTGGNADQSIVSPDGKRVAFVWFPGWWAWELDVVDIDGSNRRKLLSGIPGEAGEPTPMDWTPDGQAILIQRVEEDGNEALSLVQVSDGSVRVIKRVGQRLVDNACFSRDGRHVIYNARAAAGPQRDVFTLSVADGREYRLIEDPADDYVLGCVPGTDYLLFASDRTGPLGAWTVEVKDGRQVGRPVLVKPDLWQAWPTGFSTDGAFYYGVRVSTQTVQLAAVDPETRRLLGQPVPAEPRQAGNARRPRWSADGRYLSYLVSNGSPLAQRVAIRSTETGETREIETGLLQEQGSACPAHWSPDGRSFVLCGRDNNRRRGLFRVDVQSGRTTPLKVFEEGDVSFWVNWAPDGKSIYYRVDHGEESRIEVLDLETGVARVLASARSPLWIMMVYVSVSPDGRQLAFWETDDTTGNWSLLVIPTSATETSQSVRRLLTLGRDRTPIMGLAWTPDGQRLLYMAGEGDSARLWEVPTAGGDPHRLDLVLPGPVIPHFSPDGRRIAFEAGESSWEIWMMKNYLPRN